MPADSGKVRVQAVVRVEVELTIGPWGDNVEAKQVYAQAKREALEALQRGPVGGKRLTIVGDPKITAVLIPDGGSDAG